MEHKFEIINGTWISPKQNQNFFQAYKIDSIVYIQANKHLNGGREIYLSSLRVFRSNELSGLKFYYTENEIDQYEIDLKYLKELLFNF